MPALPAAALKLFRSASVHPVLRPRSAAAMPSDTMVPVPAVDDLAEVVRLERELLDPDVRSSSAQTQELLHRDFVEYGASGRVVWNRAAMTAALADDPGVSGPGVDFVPVRLADDVVLLTYRIVGDAGSLRSSVWVRESSRWQVRFHQGTRSQPAR